MILPEKLGSINDDCLPGQMLRNESAAGFSNPKITLNRALCSRYEVKHFMIAAHRDIVNPRLQTMEVIEQIG